MLDKQIVIGDFFWFINGDFINVLEKLSKREHWENQVTGYELPEHGDGDFGDGVMIYMETTEYGEAFLTYSEFFQRLEQTATDYLKCNPEKKEQVSALLEKVKIALKV